jgi:hypothetical protein
VDGELDLEIVEAGSSRRQTAAGGRRRAGPPAPRARAGSETKAFFSFVWSICTLAKREGRMFYGTGKKIKLWAFIVKKR